MEGLRSCVSATVPGSVTTFIRDYILSKALDWLINNAVGGGDDGMLIGPLSCPANGGWWMPSWVPSNTIIPSGCGQQPSYGMPNWGPGPGGGWTLSLVYLFTSSRSVVLTRNA